MKFVKMQGAGNDYVYVDLFVERLPASAGQVAVEISDRHFGVGADGLVTIGPSTQADFRMRMYNADGSEAEMCGNAIRCVGKYVYEQGMTDRTEISVETGAGVLELELFVNDTGVERVRVALGCPILAPERIPTDFRQNPVVNVPLDVDGRSFTVTCVSMGNPHCVVYVDNVAAAPVAELGPRIENHAMFPKRTNVEFVQVLNPTAVRQRTWERGSGETLACGTGACAVAVAGVLTGRTERRIINHLRGGDLELEWIEDGPVMMTGPAVEVFRGEWQPTI